MVHRYFLTLLLVLSCLSPSLHAEKNSIQLYWKASELSKQKKNAEAYAMYDRASHEAVAEKRWAYVWFSSYAASFKAYQLGRYPDVMTHAKLSIQTLDEHQGEKWARRSDLKQNRVELLGLLERCSSIMLKLGQGWNYNKQAIVALQKESGMPVDRNALDPKLVKNLPLNSRVLGWRLIAREARYLHAVGRSNEARNLLNHAINFSSADQQSSNVRARLYSAKLYNQLSVMESFIGYKKRAIALNQKEASLMAAGGAVRRESYLVAQLNLINNEVCLYGATDAQVSAAREILKEAETNNLRSRSGIKRLVIKIERDRVETTKRIAELENLSKENQAADQLIESFFTSRNALFERSLLGENDLDSEFNRFLEEARERGEKRVEPRIYRVYGDWLKSKNRYSEALGVYQEALRMTRQFAWHPGVTLIQAKMGAAYLADGQVASAMRVWKQMDDYRRQHPDIPQYATLHAKAITLMALLRAGMENEARELAAQAKQMGKSGRVPEKWMAPFQDNILNKYFKKSAVVKVVGDCDAGDPHIDRQPVTLQPMAMQTVARPGQGTSASFYLVNRGAQDMRGQLVVYGTGIALNREFSEENAPVFQVDAHARKLEVTVPLTLLGGCLVEIPFSIPVTTNLPNTYQIKWVPEHGGTVLAEWSIVQGEHNQQSIVLNAARLGLSPFVGIPLLHQVGFSPTDGNSKGFRLRSKIPVRIEYREPSSQQIIAVDNNGNGDFTDEGDLFPSPNLPEKQPLAPRVQVEDGTRVGSIEVWIFPRTGHRWGKETLLYVELYDALNGWEEYARNVIQDAP